MTSCKRRFVLRKRTPKTDLEDALNHAVVRGDEAEIARLREELMKLERPGK